MDWTEQRRLLVVKAAAFIAVMYAYFISRVRLAQSSRPRMTYAPMSARDTERQANLNLIYNYNDIECVAMLRMRRAPFSPFATYLERGTCLETPSEEYEGAKGSDVGIKIEPSEEYEGAKGSDVAAKLWDECAKEEKEGGSGSSNKNKRKRSVFSEEDTTIFCQTIDVVKDVVAAIRETKLEKPEIMHPDLYGAVMYQAGFSDESLIVAYSHLLDNKAQGDAFVGMSEDHHVLWLRTWLAKHYYM